MRRWAFVGAGCSLKASNTLLLVKLNAIMSDASSRSRDLGSQPANERSHVRRHSSGQSQGWQGRRAARAIKEGAIPIISDVPGFMAYYVVYAPDDTVTAISVFSGYAGAEESNRRALAWIEQILHPCSLGQPQRWPGQ